MKSFRTLLASLSCVTWLALAAPAQSTSAPTVPGPLPADPDLPPSAPDLPGDPNDPSNVERRGTNPRSDDPATQGAMRDNDSAQDPGATDLIAPTTRDSLLTDETRFQALDSDRDGRISRAEYTLAPNLQLQTGRGTTAAPDTTPRSNVGGREAETMNPAATTDLNVAAGRSTRSYQLFDQLDTDKDGFLSEAEIAAEPAADGGK